MGKDKYSNGQYYRHDAVGAVDALGALAESTALCPEVAAYGPVLSALWEVLGVAVSEREERIDLEAFKRRKLVEHIAELEKEVEELRGLKEFLSAWTHINEWIQFYEKEEVHSEQDAQGRNA